ncbi:MAG: AI-2E family transporter [Bacteroidota bacterium]
MQKTAYFLISAIGIVMILIYGQSLLVPFVMGLLFWYMMRGIKKYLQKIPFVKKNFPSWLQTTLATLTVVIVIMVMFNIISANIRSLSQSYADYEANVESVLDLLNEKYGLDILESVKGQTQNIDFGEILSSILSSLSDLIGNTFMILLYAIFILLEEAQFGKKIRAVFSEEDQYNRFNEILGEIESSISQYFRLKTLVSLLTGVLSYVALLFIGIDSPAFWAFLIFLLNYIPTIGSLVATGFPAIFALLQFGEALPAILVLGIVGFIQILVGNYIEPRLMGSSMNISPLVTIIALTLWGMIWGVIGMILSVPITVVMILVFSHFESTRPVAIMLSENGRIGNKK